VPSGKHDVILEYAKRFRCTTFIETGTENGDTVEAVRPAFSELYSIELGPNYYLGAARRFAGHSNVHLMCGDSGELLYAFLPGIRGQRILFYLDAHWKYDAIKPKKSNPTFEELDAIFSFAPNNVILIDDARTFTGLNKQGHSCPRLDELEAYVKTRDSRLTFEIKNDIIRIHL
jgi:hypothetical protein